MRNLLWLALALAFVALSYFQSASLKPTQWITGNQLSSTLLQHDSHSVQPIGVRGTVLQVEHKLTGGTTIHLETDDGTPTTIVVPPTTRAHIPKPQDRIQVEGQQLDLSTIATLNRESIKVLTPTLSKRVQLYAEVKVVRELSSGAKLVNVRSAQTGNLLLVGVAPKHLHLTRTTIGQVTGYQDSKGELIIEGIE